jgi:phosphoglucosamine mutase
MLVVDEDGMLHTGDEIIYVLASYLKENNKLKDNTVVLTIMSNLGIISSLNDNGIKVITTTVGDKYVLAELIKNNYSIGGENSGHLIMLDYLPTGDGILSAIMLLNVLTKTNKTLKELTSKIKIYPDKLVNIKVKNKAVIKDNRVLEKINEYINEYQDKIQLVVRASGTEDLVRVSCCHESYDITNNIVDTIVELIKSIDA